MLQKCVVLCIILEGDRDEDDPDYDYAGKETH